MSSIVHTGFASSSFTALENADKSSEAASALAKMCSMPSPAADAIKCAIGRASDRTNISYSRLRDIWYGDARRIEAWEMERLRIGADAAEVDVALIGLAVARRRIEASRTELSREAIAALDDAMRTLGYRPDAARKPAPRRRATDIVKLERID